MINILCFNLSKTLLIKCLLNVSPLFKNNTIYHNLNETTLTHLEDYKLIQIPYNINDTMIYDYILSNNIKLLITTYKFTKTVEQDLSNLCNIIDISGIAFTKVSLLLNKWWFHENENNNENINDKDDNKYYESTYLKNYGYELCHTYLDKIEEYCRLMNKTKKDILSTPKEEFRYFCFKYLDYIRCLELPIINKNNYYEAVLIEYRCLPHLEFLIRNCIYKLGSEWSQTIVCGNLNYEYIMDIVKKIDRDIKVIKSEFDNLFPSEYSLFLSSAKFWNLFYGEKILIYQEDTCIFKKNIMEFIQWDYIGAPWKKEQNDTPNCVGNGGLSLRSKSVMLDVISRIGLFETKYNSSTEAYMKNSRLTIPPEDVYFSKNIQDLNIGKVANWNSAYKFSCESVLHENSFGGHGIWVNNIGLMKQILYKNNVCSFNVVKAFNTSSEHRGGWNIVKNSLQNFVNSSSNILFVDNVDGHFLWDDKYVLHDKWFGFIHLTPASPDYLCQLNLNYLFTLETFKQSLINCLFLLSLSPYVTKFIRNKLHELGLNIKVFTLFHPTDINCPKFTLGNYMNNSNKCVIQIGQQLRKVTSIYRLNTTFNKIWLTGFRDINRIKNILSNESKYFNYNDLNYDDVEMKYLNSFDEYDKLLSENIVFIELFDAAANNTIVECIARNTPILVNKLPGVVDYLGEEYPLYFNNLDDIHDLLTYKNIENTYLYLKNLNKDFLDVKHFTKNFVNIIHKQLESTSFV
jgi:hypothetical protein